jgi:REP element-mobilizing transposase RayT
MPCKARIDAPGALQQIIIRGIERKRIFYDDKDRGNFVARLTAILLESWARRFAWALIPKHLHLLVRPGKTSISTVTRRLLTGYSLSFKRRHRRPGPLLQNHYKSVLCQQT